MVLECARRPFGRSESFSMKALLRSDSSIIRFHFVNCRLPNTSQGTSVRKLPQTVGIAGILQSFELDKNIKLALCRLRTEIGILKSGFLIQEFNVWMLWIVIVWNGLKRCCSRELPACSSSRRFQYLIAFSENLSHFLCAESYAGQQVVCEEIQAR